MFRYLCLACLLLLHKFWPCRAMLPLLWQNHLLPSLVRAQERPLASFSDGFSFDFQLQFLCVSSSAKKKKKNPFSFLKDLVPSSRVKSTCVSSVQTVLSSLSVGGFPETPVPDQPCNCQNTSSKCRSALSSS